VIFDKDEWLAACAKLFPHKTIEERLKFWDDAQRAGSAVVDAAEKLAVAESRNIKA
jgi:hypothetical protein